MTGLLAATSCQPAAKPRSKNEKYIKQELHKNFIYLSRSLNVEEQGAQSICINPPRQLKAI